MEQGHAGDYTGNNGKLIHKHYMENAVHDFETGHAVAGKYEAGRASAFENSTAYLPGSATSLTKQTGVSDPDTNTMPIDGLDQTLDNSAEAAFENGYGMSSSKMSVLKNRYSSMVHQTAGQTATFGPNGTDPNAALYKGIVDKANG